VRSASTHEEKKKDGLNMFYVQNLIVRIFSILQTKFNVMTANEMLAEALKFLPLIVITA